MSLDPLAWRRLGDETRFALDRDVLDISAQGLIRLESGQFVHRFYTDDHVMLQAMSDDEAADRVRLAPDRRVVDRDRVEEVGRGGDERELAEVALARTSEALAKLIAREELAEKQAQLASLQKELGLAA